jgi:hypothetical protein
MIEELRIKNKDDLSSILHLSPLIVIIINYLNYLNAFVIYDFVSDTILDLFCLFS